MNFHNRCSQGYCEVMKHLLNHMNMKNKQWSSVPYMPRLFQLLSVTGFIAPLLLVEVIHNGLTSGINCAYLASCCDRTMVVTSPQHMKCSPLGTGKSQEQSKKIHITGTSFSWSAKSWNSPSSSLSSSSLSEQLKIEERKREKYVYLVDSCWFDFTVWTVSEAAEGLVGRVS